MAQTENSKLANRAREFVEKYGSPADIEYFNKIDKQIKQSIYTPKKFKKLSPVNNITFCPDCNRTFSVKETQCILCGSALVEIEAGQQKETLKLLKKEDV